MPDKDEGFFIDYCMVDDCPPAICNGPHVGHVCADGSLVTQRYDNHDPCPFCGRYFITCVRCGRTTNDPDLWDPEAATGRIFCNACWPVRDRPWAKA